MKFKDIRLRRNSDSADANTVQTKNEKMRVSFWFIALLFACVAAASGQRPPVTPTSFNSSVDPQAVKMLRRMTDYLSGLNQFRVRVRNMDEELLDSGHKVDYDMSVKLTISRPNKLRNDRLGHLVDQSFYYDGKTLTLYNPSRKVYASVPAPPTIDKAIDYARESLGITEPVTDLIYRDPFPLLMQDVNLAVVIGEEIISGVKCTHLLFSRPGVDFQVWVSIDGPPLPHKYIVTDTGTPELLSITSTMTDWNVAPNVTDAEFKFVPPAGAQRVDFLPIDGTSGTNR